MKNITEIKPESSGGPEALTGEISKMTRWVFQNSQSVIPNSKFCQKNVFEENSEVGVGGS